MRASQKPKTEQSGLALDYVFHPKSVAVAGASTDPRKQGYAYLEHFQDYGFGGQVYPIHPKASEILGIKTYPSVKEIPGPVDYVISCIPARSVPQLMEDCVAKGVKVVHLFTGRMSETGEDWGRQLQEEVVRIAQKGGIRLIGPNCMGIYYPREGLSFKYNLPKESGPVAFFSQSGGNSVDFVYRSSMRGIRFSKVVSYGNACDLNESDFLEYFTHDPETKIITAYIEGVRDGRRFFRLLREATKIKPVIILKGGHSEAGTRAIASHTGSLAGSEEVWSALFKQTGAIKAADLGEMADIALAFQFLKPPKSRRIAVMGGGGGATVQNADDCEQCGLVIPPLPPEIRQEIRKLAPETWVLIGNPMDGSVLGDPRISPQVMKLIAAYKQVDLLIGIGTGTWVLDRLRGVTGYQESINNLIGIGQAFDKPMAIVIDYGDCIEDWRWQAMAEGREKCYKAGFPVYPTISRAARAIDKLINYYEGRERWA